MSIFKKTTIISAALLTVSLLPGVAHAGKFAVGTQANLTLVGAPNIYFQIGVGEKSAIVVNYLTIGGTFGGGTVTATGYSVAYKKYFGENRGGGYFTVGAASLNVSSSVGSSLTLSGTIPVLGGGYEWQFGSMILAAEGGIGLAGGLGIIGANVGFQF